MACQQVKIIYVSPPFYCEQIHNTWPNSTRVPIYPTSLGNQSVVAWDLDWVGGQSIENNFSTSLKFIKTYFSDQKFIQINFSGSEKQKQIIFLLVWNSFKWFKLELVISRLFRYFLVVKCWPQFSQEKWKWLLHMSIFRHGSCLCSTVTFETWRFINKVPLHVLTTFSQEERKLLLHMSLFRNSLVVKC